MSKVVRNHHYSLRNNPEGRRFHLRRGGSLKSRKGRITIHLHEKLHGGYIRALNLLWLDGCAATDCDMRPHNVTAGIHVPFTNFFVCRSFCVVHDPKPPLHSHNLLSFGKFEDTERSLIHCERHFRHDYP